ncbi:DJ-1/PfpI family protein [Thalassotalea euphylliae]|uniref:DJ-1/PfpI family protein n=1 Tax=Thalassotalea euphylliae TaxID=1655234 RepID=A0A3E0UK22_9GAMM|nr:DJ-1/PfpI family protein [Thalassotalea euphylliae]REL36082.1 DJ-1/PfpI family protein [Thalassotalea euphylliae]
MNIGIYIYDNAEVLDFTGPFEVFTTAERISDKPVFNTFLISEQGGLVTARAGYQVMSQYSIDNHPKLDILIVVGGVHNDEMQKQNVIDWISHQHKLVKFTASVCTGAFLLAQAHVVTNHQVTTHWQDIGELSALFPSLTVQESVRWVEQGNILTSAGISAGIDMSFRLIELALQNKECGNEGVTLAARTARQMEFERAKTP